MTERFRELQLRFSFLMKTMQSTSDLRERQALMLETRRVLEEAYCVIDESVAEARQRAARIERRVIQVMQQVDRAKEQKQKQKQKQKQDWS